MMKRFIYICAVLLFFPIMGFSYPAVSDVGAVNDSLTITSWSLLIEARMAGLHDSSATLGLQPDATPDFDSQYDRPSPPNPPGDWLQVYFPHTGRHWPTMLGTRFSVDITELDSASWVMNVESSLDTGLLTLSWDTSSINKLPFGYNILMKDVYLNDTINMRHQRSYQFNYSSLRTFSIWVVYNAAVLPIATGWNLISLPRIAADSSKQVLFPTAVSSAFEYEGNYVVRTALHAGKGFWLKFDGNQSVYIAGSSLLIDTINLNAGWNIIGSLSKSIQVTSITSIPPAAVTSSFFGYSGSYFPASSIDPGMGYWVRVKQSCKLILSASATSSTESRIRICPTSDRPPSPPGSGITDPGKELPQSVVLYQNFPNPFNPTSIIRYALPEQAHVRVTLVDVLGKEVAVLGDNVEEAGFHEVVVNVNTLTLSSGVYFYKFSGTGFLTGEKFDLVKKLILMK